MRKFLAFAFILALLVCMPSHSFCALDDPIGDVAPLLQKIAESGPFEYELVETEELLRGEQIWQVEIPFGVKAIERLGDGNLLVVSRSNLSGPGCNKRPKSEDDEEIISVYGDDGNLISRRSIGSRFMQWIYRSEDGQIASVVTGGYDDRGETIVINERGEECLSIKDAALYPSSDGSYLVAQRTRRPGRLPWSNPGFFSKNKILEDLDELDGFVLGAQRGCRLGGTCYPVATAVYE